MPLGFKISTPGWGFKNGRFYPDTPTRSALARLRFQVLPRYVDTSILSALDLNFGDVFHV